MTVDQGGRKNHNGKTTSALFYHVSTSAQIIFKNNVLEVGLTQNRETMALQMLTTINLFYSIMCEDPHE